ncbi:unnamed protein product [Dicrocoelium dendriticum]|nr:unnamed protein product [Dicrocoelium dendriticum]
MSRNKVYDEVAVDKANYTGPLIFTGDMNTCPCVSLPSSSTSATPRPVVTSLRPSSACTRPLGALRIFYLPRPNSVGANRNKVVSTTQEKCQLEKNVLHASKRQYQKTGMFPNHKLEQNLVTAKNSSSTVELTAGKSVPTTVKGKPLMNKSAPFYCYCTNSRVRDESIAFSTPSNGLSGTCRFGPVPVSFRYRQPKPFVTQRRQDHVMAPSSISSISTENLLPRAASETRSPHGSGKPADDRKQWLSGGAICVTTQLTPEPVNHFSVAPIKFHPPKGFRNLVPSRNKDNKVNEFVSETQEKISQQAVLCNLSSQEYKAILGPDCMFIDSCAAYPHAVRNQLTLTVGNPNLTSHDKTKLSFSAAEPSGITSTQSESRTKANSYEESSNEDGSCLEEKQERDKVIISPSPLGPQVVEHLEVRHNETQENPQSVTPSAQRVESTNLARSQPLKTAGFALEPHLEKSLKNEENRVACQSHILLPNSEACAHKFIQNSQHVPDRNCEFISSSSPKLRVSLIKPSRKCFEVRLPDNFQGELASYEHLNFDEAASQATPPFPTLDTQIDQEKTNRTNESVDVAFKIPAYAQAPKTPNELVLDGTETSLEASSVEDFEPQSNPTTEVSHSCAFAANGVESACLVRQQNQPHDLKINNALFVQRLQCNRLEFLCEQKTKTEGFNEKFNLATQTFDNTAYPANSNVASEAWIQPSVYQVKPILKRPSSTSKVCIRNERNDKTNSSKDFYRPHSAQMTSKRNSWISQRRMLDTNERPRGMLSANRQAVVRFDTRSNSVFEFNPFDIIYTPFDHSEP